MNLYKILFTDEAPKKKLDIKCGHCGVSMVEDTYNDVVISYCQYCGTVTMSRDKLDGIVDKVTKSIRENDGYGSGFALGLLL